MNTSVEYFKKNFQNNHKNFFLGLKVPQKYRQKIIFFIFQPFLKSKSEDIIQQNFMPIKTSPVINKGNKVRAEKENNKSTNYQFESEKQTDEIKAINIRSKNENNENNVTSFFETIKFEKNYLMNDRNSYYSSFLKKRKIKELMKKNGRGILNII